MRTNWVVVVILLLSTLLASCGGSEVTAPTPNNLRIIVSDATWVAYQDGDGSWQPLPETTVTSLEPMDMASLVRDMPYRSMKRSRLQHPQLPFTEPELSTLQEKTYAVSIQDADGRYGIAQVCVDPEYGYTDVYIELATVEETPENYVACYFGDDEPRNTLSGQVKGLGPIDSGVVYAGFDYVPVSPDSPSYSFEELYWDLYDVVATRFDGSSAPSSIIIKRDVSVNQNQPVDFDFGGDDAFTPELRSVQINEDTLGDSLRGGVTLSTDNYTYVPLGQLVQGTSFNYAAIPAEKLGRDTSYYLYAEAGDSLDGTTVSIGRTLTTPVDSSLTLPEPLASASAVVGSNTPYLRPTATWSPYPGSKVSYTNSYYQFSEGGSAFAFVYLREAWLPSAGEFTYTMPDFTGVAGWKNDWGLKPGTETSWDVTAYAETGRFGEDGYEEVSSDLSGSFNAPITLFP